MKKYLLIQQKKKNLEKNTESPTKNIANKKSNRDKIGQTNLVYKDQPHFSKSSVINMNNIIEMNRRGAVINNLKKGSNAIRKSPKNIIPNIDSNSLTEDKKLNCMIFSAKNSNSAENKQPCAQQTDQDPNYLS